MELSVRRMIEHRVGALRARVRYGRFYDELHGTVFVTKANVKVGRGCVSDSVSYCFLANSEESIGDPQGDRAQITENRNRDPDCPAVHHSSGTALERLRESYRIKRFWAQSCDAAPGLFMTVPHQSAGYIQLLFSSRDVPSRLLRIACNWKPIPGDFLDISHPRELGKS